MSFIDQQLQPGEKILSRVQRSRDGRHLARMLAWDCLAVIGAVLLVQVLDHTLTISYLTQSSPLGWGGFMAGTLLIGVLPFLVVLALAQDFAYTFVIEVALTDRRILGRVTGPLWARPLDLPLGEIRSVECGPFGYLVIQRSDGRQDLYLAGFEQQEGLAYAYRRFAVARRIEPRTGPLLFERAA